MLWYLAVIPRVIFQNSPKYHDPQSGKWYSDNLKYNETVLLPNTMFRSRYDLFTIEAEKFLVNVLETFILLQLKKNDWQLFVSCHHIFENKTRNLIVFSFVMVEPWYTIYFLLLYHYYAEIVILYQPLKSSKFLIFFLNHVIVREEIKKLFYSKYFIPFL